MSLNRFSDKDEPLWGRTLELMANRQIIPVVGNELLQARVKEPPFAWADTEETRRSTGKWGLEPDEWLVPWDALLASALARYLVEKRLVDASRAEGLWPLADKTQLSLSEVAGRAIRAGKRINMLRAYAKAVAEELNPMFRPSPLLEKLAAIPAFDFFVTTGCDQLLEKALESAGREPHTRWFDRKSPESANCNSLPAGQTVVYHLFGLPSRSQEFVLCDDDILEWMRTLEKVDAKPPSLLDKLHTHELLYLGCNFPDWLSRFFLRLTKAEGLNAYNDQAPTRMLAERVSLEKRDHSLFEFLDWFSEGFTMFEEDVDSFIDRLADRWRQRPRARGEAADRDDTRPLIFLSHSGSAEDTALARKLFDALNSRSLRVLFDKVELEKKPGIDWNLCLENGVATCAFFVPIISQKALAGEPGRYLHKEWMLAEERFKNSLQNRPFIIPIVSDGTLPEDRALVKLTGFKQAQWTPAPTDQAIETFADYIKSLAQAHQKGLYTQ